MAVATLIPPYREITAEGKYILNLHLGQTRAWCSTARFVVISAGTQWGKALALDTLIPTPFGFKPMGEIQEGDYVLGSNGRACRVTFASPVFNGHKCYSVGFDDGSELIADAGHLWQVQSRNDRKRNTAKYQVKTTEQLRHDWDLGDNVKNYSIDVASPVEYAEAVLPIPPYLLGAWLGDGTTSRCEITNSEDEIIDRIREDWPEVVTHPHKDRATTYNFSQGRGRHSQIAVNMHEIGVLGDKHIPLRYLTSSITQRQNLLKGIMDTDGYCDFRGQIEYTTISRKLADDVLLLVRSLGIKARLRIGKAMLHGRIISDRYQVEFQSTIPVFNLKRKIDKQKPPLTPEHRRLFIKCIKVVDSVPTKCIQVDSEDRLYLAGTSFIPTHNTCFEPDWLRREIKTCGDGDYIVGTATFPLLELKLLPEFNYVFDTAFHLGEYKDSKRCIQFHHVPGGTNGQVKVVDPTRIIFGSATHPESLESATAKGAVLDEVGQKQFLLGSWEAVQRRLSLSQGRCLFGTTLYNSGWFVNDVYGPASRGEPGYELIQGDSIQNPVFPKEEYERARASLPAWKFAMFYQGKFIRPAGLVFDCFDPAIDVVDDFEIPKNWFIHTMHDFGKANPAALFTAQDPATGQFYHFREYMPRGMERSAYEHVQEWKRITAGYNVISRYGGNWTTEDEIRQLYTTHGWPIAKPRWKEVQNQYERVYALNALHKIKVFKSLVHFIDQKTSFSYELDERYNPTDKYEDEASQHLLACERYGMSNVAPETVVNTGWNTQRGNRF